MGFSCVAGLSVGILLAFVRCCLQLVSKVVDERNGCPGEQSQNCTGVNVSTSCRHSHLICDLGPLLLDSYLVKGSSELCGVLYGQARRTEGVISTASLIFCH